MPSGTSSALTLLACTVGAHQIPAQQLHQAASSAIPLHILRDVAHASISLGFCLYLSDAICKPCVAHHISECIQVTGDVSTGPNYHRSGTAIWVLPQHILHVLVVVGSDYSVPTMTLLLAWPYHQTSMPDLSSGYHTQRRALRKTSFKKASSLAPSLS
eukprot:410979-Amphidinium_carterae.1